MTRGWAVTLSTFAAATLSAMCESWCALGPELDPLTVSLSLRLVRARMCSMVWYRTSAIVFVDPHFRMHFLFSKCRDLPKFENRKHTRTSSSLVLVTKAGTLTTTVTKL